MRHTRLIIIALLLMLPVQSIFAELFTLVRCTDTVWKYHSRHVDLGTAWRQLPFDDSSWPQGPAPLGFNGTNGNEVVFNGQTIDQLGGTVIPGQSNGGTIHTHYFRHFFNWTNEASGWV